jgi:hypothetical protein
MDLKNKLKNIPHIYYVNLDNRTDRKEYMEKQFDGWKIKNYTRVSSSKYLASQSDEWATKVISGNVNKLPAYAVGNAITHFELLKDWLNNTTDPYVILMEDDYDLNLIECWKFDWDYLMSRLPYDWDCIQLGFESKLFIPFFLHPKLRHSYFGPIMITRDYAEKLLRLHCVGDKYCLDQHVNNYDFNFSSVTVDYFMGHTAKTYSIPLITTNVDSGSTEYDVVVPRDHHTKSRAAYYYWWVKESHDYTLDEFFTYGKANDHKMVMNIRSIYEDFS